MRLARLIALLTSAALLAGAQIRFEEIARKAGVTFELRNSASGQFHQIELMVAVWPHSTSTTTAAPTSISPTGLRSRACARLALSSTTACIETIAT